MIWYNLSSYSTDPRHRHLQQPERTSNNFKAIIKNLNWIALMQIKLTVTWGSDADLVFSVRAHTWQATARALGARTEPVPGLETCSTQHWTLTPRSPHWPMAINCRVCLYVGEQHKKDIFEEEKCNLFIYVVLPYTAYLSLFTLTVNMANSSNLRSWVLEMI